MQNVLGVPVVLNQVVYAVGHVGHPIAAMSILIIWHGQD